MGSGGSGAARRAGKGAAAGGSGGGRPPDDPPEDPSESRVWHPNTQMSEWPDGFDEAVRVVGSSLVISGGGGYLLDAAGSMWTSVWGRPPRPLVDAMVGQARRMPHSPLFNLTNRPAEELASRLVEDVAPSMHRAFFSDDGSTAMEAAVKMAVMHMANRGEDGRTRIAALDGGYHGDTLGAMSLCGVPSFVRGYGPLLLRGVRRLPAPDIAAPPQGATPAEDSRRCLEKMRAAFESDPSIAALVMESGAQVAGGVVVYPDGFEREASALCRRFGVLLVLDEVATGLGRLGSMAEHEAQGSRPDIVSYGKMLTGGCLPMAATLATRGVYESFLGRHDEGRHLFHGHTYTGNPLAAAAANANLALYESEDLIARVRDSSAELGRLLDKHIRPLSSAGTVRHKGLLAGIGVAAAAPGGRRAAGSGGGGGGRAKAKAEVGFKGGPAPAQALPSLNRMAYEEGRRRGLFLRTLGDMIMLVPPLAIVPYDLERIVRRTARVLDAIDARLQAA